jgi:hypothetical protein
MESARPCQRFGIKMMCLLVAARVWILRVTAITRRRALPNAPIVLDSCCVRPNLTYWVLGKAFRNVCKYEGNTRNDEPRKLGKPGPSLLHKQLVVDVSRLNRSTVTLAARWTRTSANPTKAWRNVLGAVSLQANCTVRNRTNAWAMQQSVACERCDRLQGWCSGQSVVDTVTESSLFLQWKGREQT